MQVHLLVCEERPRECEIKGCHFFGNVTEMKDHNGEQAEKHVSLLREENEKLQDALLTKVGLAKNQACKVFFGNS